MSALLLLQIVQLYFINLITKQGKRPKFGFLFYQRNIFCFVVKKGAHILGATKKVRQNFSSP